MLVYSSLWARHDPRPDSKYLLVSNFAIADPERNGFRYITVCVSETCLACKTARTYSWPLIAMWFLDITIKSDEFQHFAQPWTPPNPIPKLSLEKASERFVYVLLHRSKKRLVSIVFWKAPVVLRETRWLFWWVVHVSHLYFVLPLSYIEVYWVIDGRGNKIEPMSSWFSVPEFKRDNNHFKTERVRHRPQEFWPPRWMVTDSDVIFEVVQELPQWSRKKGAFWK